MYTYFFRAVVTLAATACFAAPVVGQTASKFSNNEITIGLLTDMSGVYSDVGGAGALVAARMAIEDFGSTLSGHPIRLITADHQNSADISSALARRWIDIEKVDLIVGLNNSAVALAVQALASEREVISIGTGPGTTKLTEEACTPYGINWTYDTHALSTGTATAVTNAGGKRWFFITPDYAFGHSLQENASQVVEALGGTVLGSVRHPLGTHDFSSYVLQAQTSGADVIGLANTGLDAVNTINTLHEFGVVQGGQKVAALIIFSTDIHSIGVEKGQGLETTTAFYWNRTDASREWSRRFFEQHHAMPTMVQAGVYSAISNYLKAVQSADTDESSAVRNELGSMTIDDIFAEGGKVRENGRMFHDMYLVKVKSPADSSDEWDLATVEAVIPAEDAWISLADSKCPLVR